MKWIFKKLLKILLILAVLVIIFGVVPLILLYKPTTPPVEQYVVQSETNFYDALNRELSVLITDETEDTVFLTLNEAFINRVVQKSLSKDNSKYLDDAYEGELEYSYMSILGQHIGFKGVWVTLLDDQITVTAGADYISNNGKVQYQAGLEVTFDIVLSENNQYYLKVADIDIGRIGLSPRSAFKLSNFVIKSLTEKSLNEMIAENLDFGSFDENELSFTVGEDELTDYLYNIDPTFSALMKIIYRENLLILDVSDAGFDISLNIGVFRRLATDLQEPVYDSWENDSDKASFMADLAVNAAINFGMNPLDPKIDLSEADVNSILDYTLSEDVKFEFPITFTLNDQEIEFMFSSTNLYLRMDGEILSIHLRMTLSKSDLSETFDMQFNLFSTVSMNSGGDMILTINDSNIGEVDLDNEILGILFEIFDDTLMVDNTIVIPKEKLNAMFEGSNIVITDSYVSDGELRLHYGLDN